MKFTLTRNALFRKNKIPKELVECFEPAACGGCYICKMVEIFREVRRVLRSDGACFVNMGDSYAGGQGRWGGYDNIQGKQATNKGSHSQGKQTCKAPLGLKPKDLCGIPWRLAFALQADGWWLRQDIIWHKPNPMPESVRDRCTKAHEYIFLLTKAARYFYDVEAIKDNALTLPHAAGYISGEEYAIGPMDRGGNSQREGNQSRVWAATGGRNKRSVWTMATKPYPEAHFATFPPELPETCIKAGTSQKGCCPECGKPWVRIVEKNRQATRPGADTKTEGKEPLEMGNRDPRRHVTESKTTGWQPQCSCGKEAVPCTILDPFFGAGTVGLVAQRLGRNYIGIELKEDYVKMAEERIRADRPLFAGNE